MIGKIRIGIRLLTTELRGPLYIPAQGRHLIKLLESEGPGRLLVELERLSGLGSPWASAALGYIALFPEPDGSRNTDRAIELCAPYVGSEPYAGYVFAWAQLLRGNREVALASMKAAGTARFSPAMLDFVTFLWMRTGIRETDPPVIASLLRRAGKAHHKAALIYRCELYRYGDLGFAFRLLGCLLAPVARLRYLTAIILDPFSRDVFKFQRSVKEPLFRR